MTYHFKELLLLSWRCLLKKNFKKEKQWEVGQHANNFIQNNQEDKMKQPKTITDVILMSYLKEYGITEQ